MPSRPDELTDERIATAYERWRKTDTVERVSVDDRGRVLVHAADTRGRKRVYEVAYEYGVVTFAPADDDTWWTDNVREDADW